MASTFSTNLALELIGTGDQSGTWGSTTNTNLGTLLEQAISGYTTQAITDGSGANTTITIPDGATGVARNMFIEMTGALTFSTTSLVVPAKRKLYFIYNNTTGGFAVTVKVSGLTGVSVPNGRKVLLVCNGTDIVEAHNAISGNATVGGTLVVTGAATVGGTLGVTGAITNTGSLLTTPTLTNPTVTAYLETAPAIVNSSTAQTISLASGTVLSYTLTGNCTFTMPTATSGTSFIVKLIQDATGSRTAVFTGVKWPSGSAPTITPTASTGTDLISFVCITSIWYGNASQAFA